MMTAAVFEIERDGARELTTAQRRSLAELLVADGRVVGAWLAIENDGVPAAYRLERLQIAVIPADEADDVMLPVMRVFGAENRLRLYYSHPYNPKPDMVPRAIMERLGLPYTWNRYVTLGEVFKMPAETLRSDGQQ